MPKRKKVEELEARDEENTPRKTRRAAKEDNATILATAETPSNRKSILRGTPSKINGVNLDEPTPKSLRRVLFSTPAKRENTTAGADEETPTALRNDRSARRKSQRTLQRLVDAEDESDHEVGAQDEAIAQRILDSEDGSDDGEEEIAGLSSAPDTPSKTVRSRGRPKGRRRERTPSPPPDLPPHELYFFQNRAGGNKTSANTLSSHLLLNHDDFLAQMNAYKDPHANDIERLKELHRRAFDQWIFELEEGFNICLYGYGSKQALAMDFASYSYNHTDTDSKFVVINGYSPGLTIRDVLTAIASVVLPKSMKINTQPATLLESVLSRLSDAPPASPIMLIVHSLDHSNLCKPSSQAMIARLAAHSSVSLLATCDTPTFPLLWDVNLTRQLRFLYHDTTTFEPYRIELDVVEEVNTLLGRSRRRLGGKDGVGYVLKSLPENARALFRILVAEQLALTDVEFESGALGADEMDIESDSRVTGRTSVRPAAKSTASAPDGVEYRTLYHKAVEEFVCSSELNFRTLLKEFHDHQMIESRKDATGIERLVIPYRREELEGMLEELV
ncbi:hypothetical protein M433DRAFT_58086 [Acidomyces richmondensis BFW]|nr:MAG: hypothetical protein FE78DRAFT_146380 [Acidomyces sp. 'richmondensis']KYG49961.1 hypothetical protein M433DRAFT_58086 [Acidomyces richmondensis BFW]